MNKNFNLLLMISKRGFRHLPIDQKFISAQVDWVYSVGVRKLAYIARSMMQMTMSQILAIDRSKRPAMPVTRVMLSNDGTRKHMASEQLLTDNGFNISLVDTIESERVEANTIFSGEASTTKSSELAIYLNTLAAAEVGARMPTGGAFTDFALHLATIINDTDDWLVPLFMMYDNNEELHNFAITFVAKELNPAQCLKIEISLN